MITITNAQALLYATTSNRSQYAHEVALMSYETHADTAAALDAAVHRLPSDALSQEDERLGNLLICIDQALTLTVDLPKVRYELRKARRSTVAKLTAISTYLN